MSLCRFGLVRVSLPPLLWAPLIALVPASRWLLAPPVPLPDPPLRSSSGVGCYDALVGVCSALCGCGLEASRSGELEWGLSAVVGSSVRIVVLRSAPPALRVFLLLVRLSTAATFMVVSVWEVIVGWMEVGESEVRKCVLCLGICVQGGGWGYCFFEV